MHGFEIIKRLRNGTEHAHHLLPLEVEVDVKQATRRRIQLEEFAIKQESDRSGHPAQQIETVAHQAALISGHALNGRRHMVYSKLVVDMVERFLYFFHLAPVIARE